MLPCWLPCKHSLRRVRCLWCLRIAHERFGSSSDTSINGHLHYPNDVDRPLNEAAADKIRVCRSDYNNRPSNAISFIPAIVSTGVYTVILCAFYFYKVIGKLTAFFAASGVQLAQPTSGLFHFSRAAFSSQLKTKVGNILVKAAALRINLNIDAAFIPSKSHTLPSHSQTSRLLTSSLFLGVPVPHTTQCL